MNDDRIYWPFLLGALALCIIRPLWDTDLFWHVAAGDLIRVSDQLPHTDTFSAFHPEAAWVPFQWAYEVLLSLVDQLGGLSALRWLHIGLHLFAFGLVAVLAQRRLGTWGLLATVMLMVGYLDRFRARPHVFNLIGVLLVLVWLARDTKPHKDSGVLERFKTAADHDGPLLLLGVFWANLHAGGSLLLFAMLGPYALGSLIQGNPRAWPLIRALLWTALFMALSPGFLDGILQAGTMVGATRELIPEWQSTLVYLTEPSHLIHPVMGILPFAMLLLIGLTFRRRDDLPQLLTALALVGLSFTTARFLYLAALVPLLWPDVLIRTVSIRSVRVLTVLLAMLFVHEHLWVQRATPMDHLSQMDQTLEEGRFPEHAMAFIADSKIDGRAMHQSDWGGLLLYYSRDGACSLPRIRVAADGRGNLKGDVVEHLKRCHQPQGRRQYLEGSLRDFPIDLVVFPPAVFALNQYKRDTFRLVFADKHAEIYLVAGPRFHENMKRVTEYYQERAPEIFRSATTPNKFEVALRTWWGQQFSGVDDLKKFEALGLEACKSGKVKGIAEGLNAAQTLEGQGQLDAGYTILEECSRNAPPDHPIGAATNLRMVVNRLKAGATIQDTLPLLEGLRTEGLSPADHRLVQEIRQAISP